MPDLAAGRAYQMILEFEHPNGYVQKLYSAYFRKSLYASLQEKLADVTYSGLQRRFAIRGAVESDYVVDMDGLKEPFGAEEIIGLAQFPNALELSANLNQTAWVKQFETFNIDGQSVNLFNQLYCTDTDRAYDINISGSGLPPIPRASMGAGRPDKAVYLVQEGAAQLLVNRSSLPEINQDYATFVAGVGQPQILYLVPRIIYADFSRAAELARSKYNYLLIRKNFFTSIRDDADFLNGLNNATVCSTGFDREACCQENPAVQEALHGVFQAAYLDAPACVRYTHQLAGLSEVCSALRGPLNPREFYQPMTTSGSYPV
ncbi:MAG TPA: hypothetical protein VJ953_22375, partial [Saprospiraceae bacterium]|nr:hypothetical protein [Saprospiraceae bacterium]